MTAQVLFNPLSYIDRLTRGGFSPEQARASAEALETAFSESVSTKSDVDELRRDIASLKRDLAEARRPEPRLTEAEWRSQGDLSLRQLELVDAEGCSSSKISSLERKLIESEGRLKLAISKAKNEIICGIFVSNLILAGATFSIVKFVH